MVPLPLQRLEQFIQHLPLPETLLPTDLQVLRHFTQLRRLNLPAPPNSLSEPTILLSLFFTGCRGQELCNLNSADVKADDPAGDVSFEVPTLKHGNPRTVFVRSLTLSRYLNTYRLFSLPGPNEPMFHGQVSDRLTTRLLHRIVQKHFPGYSPHSFRHGFARYLDSMAVDVRMIKYLLGHRRLETTLIYLSELRAADVAPIFEHIGQKCLSPNTVSEYQYSRTSPCNDLPERPYGTQLDPEEEAGSAS